MLIWTPDTVRFQKDAAEYGSYHQTLAAHIAAYLPPAAQVCDCLLYTSPSPRDRTRSRMPSSA